MYVHVLMRTISHDYSRPFARSRALARRRLRLGPPPRLVVGVVIFAQLFEKKSVIDGAPGTWKRHTPARGASKRRRSTRESVARRPARSSRARASARVVRGDARGRRRPVVGGDCGGCPIGGASRATGVTSRREGDTRAIDV